MKLDNHILNQDIQKTPCFHNVAYDVSV